MLYVNLQAVFSLKVMYFLFKVAISVNNSCRKYFNMEMFKTVTN